MSRFFPGTIPRIVADDGLRAEVLDQVLSSVELSGACAVDRDTAKAWVFGMVGDDVVGCLAYYPPDVASLWVHPLYRGKLHATDMISLLRERVASRYNVRSLRAYIKKAHTSAARAFIDDGWRKVGNPPGPSGSSMDIYGVGEYPLEHAIVLSGGLGERLRPFTLELPKGLLPVLGKPLLEHVIQSLSACGIRNVALALGHKGPMISGIAKGMAPPNVRVSCYQEPEPYGTGGSIRSIHRGPLEGVPDTFVVANGDNLLAVDYRKAAERLASSGAEVVVCVRKAEDTGAYGRVDVGADGSVTGFAEKAASGGSGLINAGYYIFSRKALDRMPDVPRPFSLERDLFPELAKAGRLAAYDVGDARWFDVGTPERWEAAIGGWIPWSPA